jgi:hypothetical protein
MPDDSSAPSIERQPRGTSTLRWSRSLVALTSLLSCQSAPPRAPSPEATEQLACAEDLALRAGYHIYRSAPDLVAARQVGPDRVDVLRAWPRTQDTTGFVLTLHVYSGTGTMPDGPRDYVSVDPSGPSLDLSQLRDAIRDRCRACTRGAESMTRTCE